MSGSTKNTEEKNAEENKKKSSKSTGKKRKTFKQVFDEILSATLPDKRIEILNEKNENLGFDITGFTAAEYIGLIHVIKAMSGDMKSFEIIRESVGEKNAEKMNVDIGGIPKITVKRYENNEKKRN